MGILVTLPIYPLYKIQSSGFLIVLKVFVATGVYVSVILLKLLPTKVLKVLSLIFTVLFVKRQTMCIIIRK